MPIEKQFIKIYTDKKSRHSVLQHRLVDESGADYQQILAVTKAYAKEGECKINPIVVPKAEKGRKKIYPGIGNNSNPDSTTEKYGYVDVKSPHRKNNNATDACKQGGIAVITDLAMDEKITMDEIRKFSDRIFLKRTPIRMEGKTILKMQYIGMWMAHCINATGRRRNESFPA